MTPKQRAAYRGVLLRRYENQLDAVVAAELADLTLRLAALLDRLDPTAVTAGWRPQRVQRLLREAEELVRASYATIARETSAQVLEVAELVAADAARTLAVAAAPAGYTLAGMHVPTRAFLRAVLSTDIILGNVMRDWWALQRVATRTAFRTQVQLGLARNETLAEIVRRIRGVRVAPGRYEGGIMAVSRRDASALARTAMNHVANVAAHDTFRGNDDVTREYEWLATLDTRTTPICQSLDGKRFRYDDPKAPRPPAHWNCRSTIVPIIDWRGLGLTAQADDRETYGEWLRRQPVAVQNEALGVAKARRWRAGEVTLDDLVRADGRPITLKELAQRLRRA